MAYTIYNCDAMTGGGTRDLDTLAVASLADKDRAIVMLTSTDEILFFEFQSSATDAEQVATHPYMVRPDDYSSSGVWYEMITPAGNAHGMAYRTSNYTFSSTNTWENIDLDGGNANLVNVSHDTGTNPERITVTNAGIYLVHYHVAFVRSTANHVNTARIYKNGSSELAGSYSFSAERGGTADEGRTMSVMVMASLAASDYIVLQCGSSLTNASLYYTDTVAVPDPTTFITALVLVARIG